MPVSLLLDTNIIIALFAKDTSVQQHLADAEEVFLPSIVLGELYYGALRSGNPEPSLAKIDEFAAANAVLPCDAMTARNYGEIKSGLRSKGHPIPENDIGIEAIAEQHGLTLVTRDEHFSEIDRLSVERW